MTKQTKQPSKKPTSLRAAYVALVLAALLGGLVVGYLVARPQEVPRAETFDATVKSVATDQQAVFVHRRDEDRDEGFAVPSGITGGDLLVQGARVNISVVYLPENSFIVYVRPT